LGFVCHPKGKKLNPFELYRIVLILIDIEANREPSNYSPYLKSTSTPADIILVDWLSSRSPSRPISIPCSVVIENVIPCQLCVICSTAVVKEVHGGETFDINSNMFLLREYY
jgi:hypothetical protein